MKMKNHIITLAALFSLVLLAPARAATVDYVLDHSNVFADVTDYLAVSITETSDRLNFRVDTLPVLADMAGKNYGIQSFGFNFSALSEDWSRDDFLLPEGWRVQENKGMSEAGRFDVRIKGTGHSRLDPLRFSVFGLDLDDIEAGFAAHVAGFMESDGRHRGEYEGRHREEHEGRHREGFGGHHREEYEGRHREEYEGRHREGFGGHHRETSAFFYGDRLVPPSAVPLPPAVWLFGSGLLGLIGAARRRRH